MPIEIYARYANQPLQSIDAQRSLIASPASGKLGAVREFCDGDLQVTPVLFAEAFPTGEAIISTPELRRRLGELLMVTEKAEPEEFHKLNPGIQPVLDNCDWFIQYCEAIEHMTGLPVTMVVNC